MRPDLRTHSLLRIATPEVLRCDSAPPQWFARELLRAPWVVVRRAAAREGLIPVGVRGAVRSERFAAWLHPGDVLEVCDPLELAARRGWLHSVRAGSMPALAALADVAPRMRRVGLASAWGPTGSVGFELASGYPAVTAHSDLDLVVRADQMLAGSVAAALLQELAALPVRVDVLLETPGGAVALAEYASARRPILMRTASGVRLVADPWAAAAAAA